MRLTWQRSVITQRAVCRKGHYVCEIILYGENYTRQCGYFLSGCFLDTFFFFLLSSDKSSILFFLLLFPPEVISSIHCDCILIKSRHFNHLWRGVGERGCGVIKPMSLPITRARAYSHAHSHNVSLTMLGWMLH